jgi:seryl-tRNA synthetase
MIDPLLITTGLASVAAVCGYVSARRERRENDYLNNILKMYRENAAARDCEIEDLTRKSNELAGELGKIHAQRVAASKKAAAGASARAAARRAKAEAEAPARAEKTIAALRSCPPRPREAVVAGVSEARRMKRTSVTF